MGASRFIAALSAVVLAVTLGASPTAPAAAFGLNTATRPATVALSDCYPPDNGNPELVAFSVTPTALDARNGPQTVTLKVTPRDTGGPGAPSGVAGGRIYIGLTPNSDNWWGYWRMHWNGHGALVLRLTFSPQDVSALWYVSLHLRDAVGNVTNYSARDLVAAGLPASFTTQTAARPDEDRPKVHTVRLSATTLDVSDRRATLGLRVRAGDDTGVAWMEAWLYGEDNLFTTRVTPVRLREGSPRKGLWQGKIAVPRLAGNETAHLIIEMWDNRGHHRKYLPKGLAEIEQPHEVQLRGHVDTERPDPRILTIHPTSVDLRDGSQKVTLRVRVTDRGAGVSRVAGFVEGSATNMQHQGYDVRLKRVRGTAHDGIWKTTLTLPRCRTEAGRWSAYISAFDYGLPGKGASSRSITVTNDDIAPPSANVLGKTLITGPLRIRFDEDVVGTSVENIKVHQGFEMEDRPGDGPPPIAGTWACQDSAGSPVDCVNGPVRTAAFTPSTPFLADTSHTVILNPEQHLGLTDLAGNPPVALFTREVMLSNDLQFTPH